jgi:ABC-type bacteriocin/lantibiotic exporter with double-glycine peptidase domain
MKTFNVPIYKQEQKDSCGVACLRMLLSYYGFDISEAELQKEIYLHKSGSWYSDLAKAMIRRGMKTNIPTINVNIYSTSWIGKSEAELRSLLLGRLDNLSGLLKAEVEKMIEYIDMDGKLEVRIPQPEMLETLIQTQPIMVPILTAFLNPKRFDEAGHYIILTGFDGEKYAVVDPNGESYEMDKETLYYAWLANNRDSDGYLLEVVK